MKLTPTKLKLLIEEVINEAAKGAQDLPEDVYVKVFEYRNRIFVMFTDKDGEQIEPINFDTDEDNPVWGDVSFVEEDRKKPCDKSAVIAVTTVADGWGPFLYDIAMEVATKRSNGLAPDRFIVSPEARRVWDYYNTKRGDVKSFQLDNEEDSFKNGKQDDCGQSSSRMDAKLNGGEWKDSPLSKRYTKEPSIINSLGDKLIWEL